MIPLRRLLATFLLMALCGSAAAHETTKSYLVLDRVGAEISGQLSLAFRDIEVVAWMDDDLDGRITWGEAKARLDAVNSYAASRVSLEAGGTCTVRPSGAGVSQSAGIEYLVLAFEATCPSADAPLRVESALFSEIDPGHRLFLSSTDNGRSMVTVLGQGDERTLPDGGVGSFAIMADYFVTGMEHLLAGLDHLLFLIVLILPVALDGGGMRRRLLSVAGPITGFTIAHGLTLTAAATELLRPPSAFVELLIALSILLTAVHNIRPFLPGPRIALAAFFGTVHGFGFAGALSLLNLEGSGFVAALLGFNLGIEAAQIAFVVLTMPVLVLLGGGRRTLLLSSATAGLVATFWAWQRLLLVPDVF